MWPHQPSPPPIIFLLSPRGHALAERLRRMLDHAQIHTPLSHDTESPGQQLRTLFLTGHPIIGLCSSGILIRALAPILSDKTHEPPVVAVAENGRSVIPLLGGHRGANDLARRIAQRLDVTPAITTASDLWFDVDFENPPPGWRLADARPIKSLTAALLKGEKICLDGSLPWLEKAPLPLASTGTWRICATVKTQPFDAHTLVYHPTLLALGIGCERGTESEEVLSLVYTVLNETGLDTRSIALVASIDVKASEPALHAVTATLDVPLRFFSAHRLEQETPRLVTPSRVVFEAVGCHGVAESAALAAVGDQGTLIVAKQRAKHTTCAIAQALQPIDPTNVGKPQGKLAIMGIGPGHETWRSQQVEVYLKAATDLVGYGGYLDLLDSLCIKGTRHRFALGQEVERARCALDLAAAGRFVALISSGDPGIYAMATVVFDLLDHDAHSGWKQIAIEVCPGISAMQAVAARVGAPLGHDFCVISLSDLLTPWCVIERRLLAAAQGDFIVALYNPSGQYRRWQLDKAKEILRCHRRGDTVVVIGRNLGRDKEQVRVMTLDTLDAGDIDMLTLLLVGNSQTRVVSRGNRLPWVYTPRGYQTKDDPTK